MLKDQEPQDRTMDSNEFVEPILARNFDLKESGLQADGAVEYLAQTIEHLPAAEATRVVSLIGGAASGKSTFSRAIIDQLAQAGLSADVIGTDDFNKGDRAWRWENFEGKDGSDPIGKYDFALLNAKVQEIKQNNDPDKNVPVPTYNQATGLAIDEGEDNYAHRVGKVDVLIVEGDFHPVIDPDLVVYLHVPDEQRLQNRVNRDVIHRGGDPAKTTASFNFRHGVQHLPHTLPSLEQADYVVTADAANETWSFDIYQAKPQML